MKNIACFLLLALITSCATIFNGNNGGISININSHPPAKVLITDKKGQQIFMGITPTSAYLKASYTPFSRARYTLTFTKEGYQTLHKKIKAKINGWYFCNPLFFIPVGYWSLIVGAPFPATGILGGVAGLAVDGYTGEMFKIKEKNVTVELEKLEQQR